MNFLLAVTGDTYSATDHLDNQECYQLETQKIKNIMQLARSSDPRLAATFGGIANAHELKEMFNFCSHEMDITLCIRMQVLLLLLPYQCR